MPDTLRTAARHRMARELHEVLAQELSALNVQVGAARQLVEYDGPQARTILADAHRTASAALADARRLVALDEEDAARQPIPTLASVAGLVAEHAAAGYAVTLHEGREPAPVPAALGLTAYGLVQDTLDHVRRTAPATSATVAIRSTPRALEVAATWDDPDDGVPLDDLLVVLLERATLFGGIVEAGRDAGVCAVFVRVPLSA